MFTVREVRSEDLPAVTELYNQATKKLMEKDIRQWDYPWTMQRCLDLFPGLVVLLRDNQIVGAMRLVEKQEEDELGRMTPILSLEKLVIHPDCQGKQWSDHLFVYAKAQGEHHKKRVLFDCWAGNTNLVSYYSKKATYVGLCEEEDYQVAVFQL